MAKFDRWSSPWVRTWPFAVFKRHHTELNDLYWASIIATHSCERAVKLSGQPGQGKIGSAVSIRATHAKRMDFSIEEWKVHVADFGNWTRLASLMSLASYFETYLSAVCQLALLSNPGIMLKSSKSIDGISLLKSLTCQEEKSHIERVREEVIGIVKGDWSTRFSNYERLFGAAPIEFSKGVAALNEVRKMRNGVGHTFGRTINEYEDPLVFVPKSIQRLSELRLQNWLGVVEKIAVSIDQHLRGHIGAFEVLWKYHKTEIKIVGHRSEAQSFRELFPDAQGSSPKKEYFAEAINYYKKA